MELSKVSDTVLRREFNRRFYLRVGTGIGSSSKAAEHFRSLFSKYDRDREHFAVVYLNQQNEVLSSEVLFSGSLSSSAVYPRELIKRVLGREAASIVIGHNHPSGSIQPSGPDRQLTRKLKTALESIDVALLDHIIIGNGSEEHFAFSEHDLI